MRDPANGHMDLAEEIGADYEKFGTLLLEDKKGNKVKNIKVSKRGDPVEITVEITVEILKQWLQRKGRKPVAWQTLVKCLRDTDLNALQITWKVYCQKSRIQTKPLQKNCKFLVHHFASASGDFLAHSIVCTLYILFE